MNEGGPSMHGASERVRWVHATWRAQPTWLHRVAAVLVVLLLPGIAAALIVWGLIFAAVLAVIGAIIMGVRALRRAAAGRDPLRKNVRIVRRD